MKRTTLGTRAPKDVQVMMEAAEEATGCSPSELLVLCIRRSIREVVADILKQRKTGLEKLGITLDGRTAAFPEMAGEIPRSSQIGTPDHPARKTLDELRKHTADPQKGA